VLVVQKDVGGGWALVKVNGLINAVHSTCKARKAYFALPITNDYINGL
jgi:microcompartment protein CcmL/EutN